MLHPAGEIPQPRTNVLQRCAGSHRCVRCDERRHIRPGEDVGKGAPGACPTFPRSTLKLGHCKSNTVACGWSFGRSVPTDVCRKGRAPLARPVRLNARPPTRATHTPLADFFRAVRFVWFTPLSPNLAHVQRQASPNIVIALAGNKADLASKRQIEYDVSAVPAAVGPEAVCFVAGGPTVSIPIASRPPPPPPSKHAKHGFPITPGHTCHSD